ncbi:MAG: hypothetical protein ACE5LH_09430, partial [Fidelibacterota bacterium]
MPLISIAYQLSRHRPGVLGLFSLLLASSSVAQGPDWSVTPTDYESSATVTGVLYVDYELANDPANIVGAFVGETCRGVASPILVSDTSMYFLTVYSNSIGETIAFKSYLASDDTIVDVNETIQFIPDNSWGSPENPFSWNAILYYDHPPSVEGVPDQTIEVGETFPGFDL